MAEEVELVAPFRLSYAYKRSTGPVVGRFLTSLRDQKLEGIRTASGDVLFPPRAYDPRSGASTSGDFVEVQPEGVVKVATWVAAPRPQHPVSVPFSWALIQLDGADTTVFHAVVADEGAVAPGTRVRVVWASEREGSIRDIAHFEVIA